MCVLRANSSTSFLLLPFSFFLIPCFQTRSAAAAVVVLCVVEILRKLLFLLSTRPLTQFLLLIFFSLLLFYFDDGTPALVARCDVSALSCLHAQGRFTPNKLKNRLQTIAYFKANFKQYQQILIMLLVCLHTHFQEINNSKKYNILPDPS